MNALLLLRLLVQLRERHFCHPLCVIFDCTPFGQGMGWGGTASALTLNLIAWSWEATGETYFPDCLGELPSHPAPSLLPGAPPGTLRGPKLAVGLHPGACRPCAELLN